MRRGFLMSLVLAMAGVGSMFAATTQTLQINGEEVDKVVSSITFDGDKVVLHFGEDTESYDMNVVSIALETTVDSGDTGDDDKSGITDVKAFSFKGVVEGDWMTVGGVAAGTNVVVYNLNGATVAAAQADGAGVATVNISQLAGGVYIVRAGNQCVKFVKR
ncbi:MAG: T9SS type A sorting domain-containing protein [Muribaculaceae bacterium]|nr:T9SS type A sorting domain-containing protein [Muribaculaceae bacterium]